MFLEADILHRISLRLSGMARHSSDRHPIVQNNSTAGYHASTRILYPTRSQPLRSFTSSSSEATHAFILQTSRISELIGVQFKLYPAAFL